MAMGSTIAIPRMELLQVADAVAREKGIDRDDVLVAMEQAIRRRAARNTATSTTFAPRSTTQRPARSS